MRGACCRAKAPHIRRKVVHHGPYTYTVKEKKDSAKKAAEVVRHLRKSVAEVLENNKRARPPVYHCFVLLEGVEDILFYKKFLDCTVARRWKVSLITCAGRSPVVQVLKEVSKDLELRCSTVSYRAFVDRDHSIFHPEEATHWTDLPPWQLYVTSYYSHESYCVPPEVIPALKDSPAWLRWWSLYCVHRRVKKGIPMPDVENIDTPVYPIDIEAHAEFCAKTFDRCQRADPRAVWRGKNLLQAYSDYMTEKDGRLHRPADFVANASIPDRLASFLSTSPGPLLWLKWKVSRVAPALFRS